MLLMMIFPFGADPLVTVSITILNTVGIMVVLLFVLMWRRAASPSDSAAKPDQPVGSAPMSRLSLASPLGSDRAERFRLACGESSQVG